MIIGTPEDAMRIDTERGIITDKFGNVMIELGYAGWYSADGRHIVDCNVTLYGQRNGIEGWRFRGDVANLYDTAGREVMDLDAGFACYNGGANDLMSWGEGALKEFTRPVNGVPQMARTVINWFKKQNFANWIFGPHSLTVLPMAEPVKPTAGMTLFLATDGTLKAKLADGTVKQLVLQ